jgi:hypothetical protein
LTCLPRSEQIEQDDAAARVYVCALSERSENEITGWEPRSAVVIQATKKFLPS